jgi:hypothetical protein
MQVLISGFLHPASDPWRLHPRADVCARVKRPRSRRAAPGVQDIGRRSTAQVFECGAVVHDLHELAPVKQHEQFEKLAYSSHDRRAVSEREIATCSAIPLACHL